MATRTNPSPKTKRLHILPPELHAPAIAQVAEQYPPGNKAGVIGADVGTRTRKGRKLPGEGLRIFVRRKRSKPARPIDDIEFIHEGVRYIVTPDVVAAGRIRAGHRSRSPVFSGLHAGAAIQTYYDKRMTGAVGCLLGAQTTPTHLLTAGHLFTHENHDISVYAGDCGSSRAVKVGYLVRNFLFDTTPHDAALVALEPRGRDLVMEPPHQLLDANFWQYSPPIYCAGKRVQAARSTVQDWSPVSSQNYTTCFFDVSARFWPDGYRVKNVFQTTQPITVAGDSGCPLLSADPGESERAGLGVCIGGLEHGGSLFEPFEEIMNALKAQGHSLRILPA